MKLVDTGLDFWGVAISALLLAIFLFAALFTFAVLTESMSGTTLILLAVLVAVFVVLLVVRKGLAKREPRMRR